MLSGTDSEPGRELAVTFFPALYLQRRIWILDILRRENVSDVLDVGCGEGQLLAVLSLPSPWLSTPPQSLIYPDGQFNLQISSVSPISLYNTPSDPIPNLHITRLAGLDKSSRDLEFTAQAIAPPDTSEPSFDPWRYKGSQETVRWEEMTAKLWQGGLEIINEEFVGTECIVSSEVIEHLPPHILPFYAPILLGVYKPKLLLITTPSYSFNALFTSPNSDPSIRLRSGFSDPTGRTDRIFRHEDHQFEWTPEEFRQYCEKEAANWGYTVDVGDVGRAQEADAWGRDHEVGGASLVAIFRRIDDKRQVDREAVEKQAREFVEVLTEQHSTSSSSDGAPQSALPSSPTVHRLLITHTHPAHPSAQNPLPIHSIGDIVKSRMEDLRESFLRVEELWYEPEVAQACGGWIELLIAAVEEYDHADGELKLVKDAESPEDPILPRFLHSPNLASPRSASPTFSSSSSSSSSSSNSDNIHKNIQHERDLWKICLVGAMNHPRPLWPTTEITVDQEGDRSTEYMSSDWTPERDYAFEYGDVSGYSYDLDEAKRDHDQDDYHHPHSSYIDDIDDLHISDTHETTENDNFDYAETLTGSGTSVNAEWNLDPNEEEDNGVNDVSYSTAEKSWGESDTAEISSWEDTGGSWGRGITRSGMGEGGKSGWDLGEANDSPWGRSEGWESSSGQGLGTS
ncbi:hypothetical protein GGU10DRAFT_168104 [Lentinula aff. detonsa]|uniref:Small RNA 2'-O-methyltransferase n=1 Tax=Lentinula aff. detonsa TaxID=2804958 RepID=A0AA38KKD6_9AGAR|nr:hypothetical protein GGU10DRAFT_168104 [Lentinula aff. detonsa]